MEAFYGTLLGDGLIRLHRALYALEEDPLYLDRTRRRFSQSPPQLRSIPSGTPTRSASPELSSDEQRERRLGDQRFYEWRQLMDEPEASYPGSQFRAQKDEETRRICNANRMSQVPEMGTEEMEAIETIKKRWVEQGIWKNKWDGMAAGRYSNVGSWKHERESESETDTEAKSLPPNLSRFGVTEKHPQQKLRRRKINGKMQRAAEQQAIRERNRQASHPYCQFVYQISKERERIQDESTNEQGADAANINTRAYENVKNTWTKRMIWSERWGILPGMSWKHEWPREETEFDRLPVSANPLVTSSHDVGEASTMPIFGSPSSVALNHRQISGIMHTSQQGPSTDIDSARQDNGDAERYHSASNPPQPKMGKVGLRSSSGQTSRPQSLTGISLGPDIAELLPQTTGILPRRSKRLERLETTTAKGPTGIASMVSLKGIARSRPKRKAAGNPKSMGSAKHQGISKRLRSNKTWGKTRKDSN